MYNSEDTVPRRRRTPSFSSSLLDAIYRSIDESKSDHHHHHHHHHHHQHQHKHQHQQQATTTTTTTTTKKRQSNKEDKEFNNLRRAIMVESWVEKQSVASRTSTLSNSGSSSSESIWSSSETESRPNPKTKQKPKPKPEKQRNSGSEIKQSPRPCNGFSKTKLKAMKIYGELKKVKQPISPGGRIASFLNSIFNPGNVKKAKMCYVGAVEDVNVVASSSKSVSSAASTFSRSCLSKPHSSRADKHGSDKRSVRFYPVSVILGEDSKPCGHKRVYGEDDNDPCLMPLSSIRGFVKSSSSSLKGGDREGQGFLRRFCDDHHDEADDEDDDDDDDDDDNLSCSSSDLFELDHLVGVGRYMEELPVYETTSLKTNQAIANGLIL